MSLFTFDAIKILSLAFLSSITAMVVSKFLIDFLYKIQFWKKKPREKTIDGQIPEVFLAFHKEKEVNTPRGGGIIIWLSMLIVLGITFLISHFSNIWWADKLNFLSREETWIPFFALIAASLIGLIDDISVVYGTGKYIGGGLKFSQRFALVFLIGLIGGAWMYFKLGWDSIHIPLISDFPHGIELYLGLWYIVLYLLVTMSSWASGVIDGLDGLAGGVFSSIFGAFTIIAFAQGKVDLAVFCAAILGTLFSFLWFNIPPAKFYMGETGILGLAMTMTAIAFMTDSVAVLPIIAGVLVIETGSVIIQLLSKRFRHKKIWLSTPIHHHLEAIGWKPYQITMRFWIIGVVLAILGVSIQLLK